MPCVYPRTPCHPRSPQPLPLPGLRRAGRNRGFCLHLLSGSRPRPAGQVELSPGEVSSHASAPPPSLEGSPDCRGKPPGASPLLTVSPLSVRSCEPFSIYAPWGERCEHLGLKLGAFFGILFGALGFLLLLGAAGFVVLRFWCYSGNHYSYPLDSES